MDWVFLFDYLCSKLVFDYEDCEIVCVEKMNECKVSKLLDIFEIKGIEGLKYFFDVL